MFTVFYFTICERKDIDEAFNFFQHVFYVAKAKRQLQVFYVAKAKRQLQVFCVAKAKRQLQVFCVAKAKR
ncbi:hypothetical protein [Lysinibacillus xylanilyticus]|uniref:hypothetical protein n=1 Tax=Lysinibacillus xylanilyticus TaxID=582475 RepID=UPI0038192E8E